MIRQRSFCKFCGSMTTYLDGACSAHRDLLAALALPPDPLELIPTLAAETLGEEESPREGMEA